MDRPKFQINDKLRFSDVGLSLWLAERRGFFEPGRYKKWRWRVISIREDGWLVLERTDGLSPMKGMWSPAFFEANR